MSHSPNCTVTINKVSPSGFGHVAIFEHSARAVVARAPPEILNPSDVDDDGVSFGTPRRQRPLRCWSQYKSMGK